MKIKSLFLVLFLIYFSHSLSGQLKLGTVLSEVNFREGPGLNFRIIHSINSTNLLVILPREPFNGFVEAFDIETNSHGFVYESLINVTDSLHSQEQKFFEKSGINANGDVEIELINRTDNSIYIWINNNSYILDPREKKRLILEEENITYFSSAPGLFPVFGREVLEKGNLYQWDFSI